MVPSSRPCWTSTSLRWKQAVARAALQGAGLDGPGLSDQFISGQKSGLIPVTIKATQICGPSFTGGAAYLGIPKDATNKDGAAKLANYVLGAEAQNTIAMTIAGYPMISLLKLPEQTQAIFKEAHPEQLRPAHFGQMEKDMNKASVGAGRCLGAVIGAFKPIDHLAALVIAREAGALCFGAHGEQTSWPLHGGAFLVAAPGVADELRELFVTCC